MASIVAICNLALQRIGADRIVDILDPNQKEARECNAIYDDLRASELRTHTWNFAKVRIQLAADSIAPVFGRTNAFTLPADSLRVIKPSRFDTDWLVEGRKILTDFGAPLDLVYIQDVTDPNRMDALFRRALALEMAVQMVEALTQSNSKYDRVAAEKIRVLNEARRTNAMERVEETTPDDTWLTVRELGPRGNRMDNKFSN